MRAQCHALGRHLCLRQRILERRVRREVHCAGPELRGPPVLARAQCPRVGALQRQQEPGSGGLDQAPAPSCGPTTACMEASPPALSVLCILSYRTTVIDVLTLVSVSARRQHSLLLRRSVLRSARLLLGSKARLTLAAQAALPGGATCRAAALADSRTGGAVLLNADWHRGRAQGQAQGRGASRAAALRASSAGSTLRWDRGDGAAEADGDAAAEGAEEAMHGGGRRRGGRRRGGRKRRGGRRVRAAREAREAAAGGRAPDEERGALEGGAEPGATRGTGPCGREPDQVAGAPAGRREPDQEPGMAQLRLGCWAPLAQGRPGWRLHLQHWLSGRLMLNAHVCGKGVGQAGAGFAVQIGRRAEAPAARLSWSLQTSAALSAWVQECCTPALIAHQSWGHADGRYRCRPSPCLPLFSGHAPSESRRARRRAPHPCAHGRSPSAGGLRRVAGARARLARAAE